MDPRVPETKESEKKLTPVDLICQVACNEGGQDSIEDRVADIESVLSFHGVTIDVFFKESEAPVQQLARKNKTEAVMFLINKMGASKRLAMLSAGIGGHVELIDRLLETATDPVERCWLSAEAVCGLIMSDDSFQYQGKIQELCNIAAVFHDGDFLFRKTKVRALAFNDTLDEVEFSQWLKEAEAVHWNQFEGLLFLAMYGYAESGNINRCEGLLDAALNSGMKNYLLECVVIILTTNRRHLMADAVLKKYGTDIIAKAKLLAARAEGYCYIGNDEAAQAIFDELSTLSDPKSPETNEKIKAILSCAEERMVLAAAKGGHVANALKIRNKANDSEEKQDRLLMWMLQGLAQQGVSPEVINNLLNKLHIPEDKSVELFWKVKLDYARQGFVTQAERRCPQERADDNIKYLTINYIVGYIFGGFYEKANEIMGIVAEGNPAEYVYISGFVLSALMHIGRQDLLNIYIQDHVNPYAKKWMTVCANNHHIGNNPFLKTKTPEAACKLLSVLPDPKIRAIVFDLLPKEAKQWEPKSSWELFKPSKPSPAFRAEKFHEAKQHNLTDREASAWCQAGIPYWFLSLDQAKKRQAAPEQKEAKGKVAIGCYPDDIIGLINSFLLPISKYNEEESFTRTLYFVLLCRQPAVNAVQKYYESTGFFGLRRDEQAGRLLKACRQTKSKDDLIKALQTEAKSQSPLGQVVYEQLHRLSRR